MRFRQRAQPLQAMIRPLESTSRLPPGPQPLAPQSQSPQPAGAGHSFAAVAPRHEPVQADLIAEDAGRPLPAPLREDMETAFSADFSAVRVFQGTMASLLGARAYARGEDLHFAPGIYAPASPVGRHVIGHELAHVVQQRRGHGIGSQDPAVERDAALEAEAASAGSRAAAGRPADVRGSAAGVQLLDGEEAETLIAELIETYKLNTRSRDYSPQERATLKGRIQQIVAAAKTAAEARTDVEAAVARLRGTQLPPGTLLYDRKGERKKEQSRRDKEQREAREKQRLEERKAQREARQKAAAAKGDRPSLKRSRDTGASDVTTRRKAAHGFKASDRKELAFYLKALDDPAIQEAIFTASVQGHLRLQEKAGFVDAKGVTAQSDVLHEQVREGKVDTLSTAQLYNLLSTFVNEAARGGDLTLEKHKGEKYTSLPFSRHTKEIRGKQIVPLGTYKDEQKRTEKLEEEGIGSAQQAALMLFGDPSRVHDALKIDSDDEKEGGDDEKEGSDDEKETGPFPKGKRARASHKDVQDEGKVTPARAVRSRRILAKHEETRYPPIAVANNLAIRGAARGYFPLGEQYYAEDGALNPMAAGDATTYTDPRPGKAIQSKNAQEREKATTIQASIKQKAIAVIRLFMQKAYDDADTLAEREANYLATLFDLIEQKSAEDDADKLERLGRRLRVVSAELLKSPEREDVFSESDEDWLEEPKTKTARVGASPSEAYPPGMTPAPAASRAALRSSSGSSPSLRSSGTAPFDLHDPLSRPGADDEPGFDELLGLAEDDDWPELAASAPPESKSPMPESASDDPFAWIHAAPRPAPPRASDDPFAWLHSPVSPSPATALRPAYLSSSISPGHTPEPAAPRTPSYSFLGPTGGAPAPAASRTPSYSFLGPTGGAPAPAPRIGSYSFLGPTSGAPAPASRIGSYGSLGPTSGAPAPAAPRTSSYGSPTGLPAPSPAADTSSLPPSIRERVARGEVQAGTNVEADGTSYFVFINESNKWESFDSGL